MSDESDKENPENEKKDIQTDDDRSTIYKYDPITRKFYPVKIKPNKDIMHYEGDKRIRELTPEEIDRIMRGNTKL